MTTAVETHELRRVYAGQAGSTEVVALDSVSLAIEEGEVRGLLGPNGAGKTSLVKILSTVLLPTSGRASVLGFDVVKDTDAVRPIIGIVFGGDRGLYWHLTGRQNLEYWAALYKVPASSRKARTQALLERVGLSEWANNLVRGYSRGMKQRLHLARGLVADARVLFLDEPTTGLDPVAARDFRSLIQDLRAEGRTILITTHDMAEAEAVCDQVTLIDRGQILATETPRTLGRLIANYDRIDYEGGTDDLPDKLRALPGVESVTARIDGGYRIEVNSEQGTENALALLVDSHITSIQTSRPSLEEVYVHIIGDRGLQVRS